MGIQVRREYLVDYGEYVKKLTEAYEYLTAKKVYPFEGVWAGLTKARGYSDDRKGLQEVLQKVGVGYAFPELGIERGHEEEWQMLGLVDDRGGSILAGRYIVPIRDFMGGIIALVGWKDTGRDQKRKYITAGDPCYFKKASLWFGLEQVGCKTGKKGAVVCEGIFDTLAVRGLGFKAYGTMGITVSLRKKALYYALGEGGRILGIPDQDSVGENAAKKDNWGIYPKYGSYLRWDSSMGESVGIKRIKDIDDLVKATGEETARDLLLWGFSHAGRTKEIRYV